MPIWYWGCWLHLVRYFPERNYPREARSVIPSHNFLTRWPLAQSECKFGAVSVNWRSWGNQVKAITSIMKAWTKTKLSITSSARSIRRIADICHRRNISIGKLRPIFIGPSLLRLSRSRGVCSTLRLFCAGRLMWQYCWTGSNQLAFDCGYVDVYVICYSNYCL